MWCVWDVGVSLCMYISLLCRLRSTYIMHKLCTTLYTSLSIPLHLHVSSVFPCIFTNYKLNSGMKVSL